MQNKTRWIVTCTHLFQFYNELFRLCKWYICRL